ncbi:hypothetical protein ANCCEY_09472 [Ancylostoma ceylanicum]|uniref:Uncharacterized protein n=1 Tax=Ancylostoma ceylanicum TaxID=53326 RepID=A0A0D6LHG5_9BILA|nr:hypothetical protein ANCCEY_09472 [Ancylostoma ceylanicum]
MSKFTGDNNMKDIFRSLFVISMTVVFGWFSTTLLTIFTLIIQTTFSRLQLDMLAGLFVNLACASNFFVYYALSSSRATLPAPLVTPSPQQLQ